MISITIPAEVIQRANKIIDTFVHCKKRPDISVLYMSDKWEIQSAMCRLDNHHNRGRVGSSCDACKIKKDTGKYPGEDFHPL